MSSKDLYVVFLLALLVLADANAAFAQSDTRKLSIAVLDFGNTETGRVAADTIATTLKRSTNLTVVDRDQARAAARGAGYAGSLNMSLTEARTLGEVLGSDFFMVGDAQTLRRSPSSGPLYFESYASIFLVSSRTGRLIVWERPVVQTPSAKTAHESLIAELLRSDTGERFNRELLRAFELERNERAVVIDGTPVIEAAPDEDEIAEAEGLRLPKPFRRLIPTYPDTAAKAEAEAMVDVLVDLDATGEVTRVEVARWAGFGLDESTVETVKRLHFFPAHRDGVAIPIRVLLRYNFRKPPR